MKQFHSYTISFLLLLLVFLLLSCHVRKDTSAILSQADSLISILPDSALNLLINTDLSAEDFSIKARYALLLTQAKDKNYIQHTDDSLICIAVHYYDSIGDVEQAARAHYYLGRVHQDMYDDAKATKEFLKALILAKQSDEPLLCLLYGNLGQICFRQNKLDSADSLFILSENIAVQRKDSFNLAMGLVARGNVFMQKEKYLMSMRFFEQALFIAKSIQNKNVVKIVYNSMATLCTLVGYSDKSLEYSEKGLKCGGSLFDSTRLYLLEGYAMIELERYDSAMNLITRGINSKDLNTKASAYSLLADIKERQGDLNEALIYQDNYFECYDSLNTIERRTQNVISEGRKIMFLESYKEILDNYCYLIYGLFFGLFVLVVCWVNSRYHYNSNIKELVYRKNSLEKRVEVLRAKQDELRKKEEELAVIQMFIGDVEEDKARLYFLTNQIVLFKRESRDFFLKLLINAQSYKTLLSLIQKKKRSLDCRERFTEKDWQMLMEDINYFSNGFVDRLRERSSIFSDSDIRFCGLIKIGLTYGDIALIFERTLDAMYKKRNAIIENKLSNFTCHSLEEWVNSI